MASCGARGGNNRGEAPEGYPLTVEVANGSLFTCLQVPEVGARYLALSMKGRRIVRVVCVVDGSTGHAGRHSSADM